MNGGITKLKIEAYTKPDFSGSPHDSYEAMFNPSTFVRKHEVEYNARQGQGDTGSPQIFKVIKPQDYSFDFVVDGTGVTGTKINVEENIKHLIKVTGECVGEIHRPPYLKISYGDFLVQCILKNIEITYTLFSPEASPLRAKVKINVSEQIEDKKRTAEDRKSSPDLTHRRIVKQGDILSLLTAEIYGDESRYLQVAQFNNLKNFRKLEVGQVLLFPPIKNVDV